MRVSFRKRRVHSIDGFSLVETLVSVALLGILVLGASTVFTEFIKTQRGGDIKALLLSQKIKIEGLFSDDQAWLQMITQATNTPSELACLRIPPSPVTGCAQGTYTNSFVLFETNGTPYYDPRAATNQGFTAAGALCAPATTPACAIRWTVTLQYTCEGASPCMNPAIRITAVPAVTPANQEALNISVNPENYQVDVTRRIGTRFDPILMSEVLSDSGAGQCSTSGVTRRINTEIRDPANNVRVLGGGNMEFQPGTYQCRITAPAFKVGYHFITFETGGIPLVPGGTSPRAYSAQRLSVPSNAQIEVTFAPGTTTIYRLRHTCEFSSYPAPSYPGETTDLDQQLGFTLASLPALYNTTNVTYATVSCYRTR